MGDISFDVNRTCPHCRKKDVSHRANTCPYCTKPITPLSFWKTKTGYVVIFLACFFGLILIVALTHKN